MHPSSSDFVANGYVQVRMVLSDAHLPPHQWSNFRMIIPTVPPYTLRIFEELSFVDRVSGTANDRALWLDKLIAARCLQNKPYEAPLLATICARTIMTMLYRANIEVVERLLNLPRFCGGHAGFSPEKAERKDYCKERARLCRHGNHTGVNAFIDFERRLKLLAIPSSMKGKLADAFTDGFSCVPTSFELHRVWLSWGILILCRQLSRLLQKSHEQTLPD